MTLFLVCTIVPLLFGLWAQMKVKRTFAQLLAGGAAQRPDRRRRPPPPCCSRPACRTSRSAPSPGS